ncbi:MAG: 4-hydroxy-tetrahydrodipicolinate reductase [Chloroflexota bacterium]|nr:MAG: 4-hydroxy-tetrahydrodipicolinate reductase [Chloroflexota bacterium]
MTTRLCIVGLGGRMGREIAAAAVADSRVSVAGGTVRAGALAGRSFAQVAGVSIGGARVSESLAELLPDADVVVDFTNPVTTLDTARVASEAGRALVIGTTGMTGDQIDALRARAERVPILYGRNMSVGVNALAQFLPILARALAGYDVEIIEAHHRFKKDAPSGTALILAEAIVAALGKNLADVATYGREGISPRREGEIGIHAIRAGGNAGEHTVIFADEGEEIRVSHRANSRRTFALGALRAAAWIAQQPPGFHSMADLLH